jgi:hypothetical protein
MPVMLSHPNLSVEKPFAKQPRQPQLCCRRRSREHHVQDATVLQGAVEGKLKRPHDCDDIMMLSSLDM